MSDKSNTVVINIDDSPPEDTNYETHVSLFWWLFVYQFKNLFIFLKTNAAGPRPVIKVDGWLEDIAWMDTCKANSLLKMPVSNFYY